MSVEIILLKSDGMVPRGKAEAQQPVRFAAAEITASRTTGAPYLSIFACSSFFSPYYFVLFGNGGKMVSEA